MVINDGFFFGISTSINLNIISNYVDTVQSFRDLVPPSLKSFRGGRYSKRHAEPPLYRPNSVQNVVK